MPQKCTAIYIGIFEQESEYGLHFLGSTEFDADHDDWACEKPGDYIPRNRYLLDTGIPTTTDWQETLSLIAAAMRRVSSTSASVLSDAGDVAVGFDDGDLERI
ncbi:MAG: hypothetical protein AAFX44_05490 [Pseudomonadota bacterium]